MMLRTLITENPVLIKHLRSRLRLQHLIPLIAMVVTLCICISWAGIASGGQGPALMGILVLQGLLLFLVGAATVATAVSHARDNGMLDFHRISPQQPTAVTVGFLLGAPIREYVLLACTLPFSLILAVGAKFGLFGWLAVMLDLVVVSLLYYSVAILAGLALPQRTSSTILTLLFVFGLNAAWLLQPIGSLTIVPTALEAFRDQNAAPAVWTTLLGSPAPAFLVSLLHQVPVLIFLLIAAARKMRHEFAYPFAKADAISFYFVMGLLLLVDAPGGIDISHQPSYSLGSVRAGVAALSYGLLLLGVFFATLVTPNAGAFARGIRHARKLGLTPISRWEDRAANPAALVIFAAVFAAAGVVATLGLPGTGSYGTRAIAAALVGACAVLFWGLAKQSFDLTFRRHSNSYFMLLLFACWGLPLILGLLISAVTNTDASGVLALSPLSGIAVLLSEERGMGLTNAGYTAVIASLVLVIAFALLTARAVRRTTSAASAAP